MGAAPPPGEAGEGADVAVAAEQLQSFLISKEDLSLDH